MKHLNLGIYSFLLVKSELDSIAQQPETGTYVYTYGANKKYDDLIDLILNLKLLEKPLYISSNGFDYPFCGFGDLSYESGQFTYVEFAKLSNGITHTIKINRTTKACEFLLIQEQ